MKSVHSALTIVTIILTGERVSDFLATNAGVLAAIVAVCLFWRYAMYTGKSKPSDPDAK